jgi:anti-sigma-K factor RskA
MDLRNKAELQDRLAAEYALGTLRGQARARFRRWLRADASVARAAAEWEARLAPLIDAVAAVAPPARLWLRIEQRIGAAAGAAGGLWNRIGFWRNLGLAASGMAATLLAVLIVVSPQPPRPAPPPVVVMPDKQMPSYLAMLTDPRTQVPVLLVSAGRKSDQLWVKTLEPGIHVAGKSLQLWAIPKSGPPVSLGLVSTEEKGMLKLVSVADQSLAQVPALAVSLEPQGGSPTGLPTGPILFSGPCIKYW